ncbi:hypothetical protein DEU56DRAFT_785826 [Suillus clintonianus]|uniref:uncharacterized protein n=1 Tax=Suillus clintonianus TaxID=1904413 RepID=UPI001B87EF6E|nr:uncharacterized protein DEU56DRAFT_785826 [Suillus clintonianus]KAG2146676.1 hypothetical protein DEU56DRAFT_785826 [Suillus clintonianus]
MTESLVAVRVELPTYSLSFTVEVPISATVLDVKHAILVSCSGQPRVEGQRIIWRGRYLGDQEKISEIWKTADEQRIVHLSVHPSAWSGAPPSSSSATSTTIPISDKGKSPLLQRDASSNTPLAPSESQSHPFARLPLDHQFIAYIHQAALSKLTRGLIERPQDSVLPSRSVALENLEKKGYVWPSILDEPYPFSERGDGSGLQYELMTTDGKSYLSLRNPGSRPTAEQVHALKVLTYTFSILFLQPLPQPPTPTPTISSTEIVPPQLNDLLQQLGLPPLRAMPNVNVDVVNGQMGVGANIPVPGDEAQILPDIPVRVLLAPLVMVFFRTLLLLYFFSPTRKPLLGLCIIAWIIYEMWTNVRNVILGPLNRERERLAGVAAEAARQAPGQGQPGGPTGTPAPPAPPTQPDILAPAQTQEAQGPPPPSNSTSLLDLLARIGIDTENKSLWPTPPLRTPLLPPSLMHKVTTFVSLLVLTLHPEVWNRRRAALRTREGRLRTEANVMEREVERVEGQEMSEDDKKREDTTAALRVQDGRRALWVKSYIQRVRGGEWADDL